MHSPATCPCQNGGTCTTTDTCACVAGRTGQLCETGAHYHLTINNSGSLQTFIELFKNCMVRQFHLYWKYRSGSTDQEVQSNHNKTEFLNHERTSSTFDVTNKYLAETSYLFH